MGWKIDLTDYLNTILYTQTEFCSWFLDFIESTGFIEVQRRSMNHWDVIDDIDGCAILELGLVSTYNYLLELILGIFALGAWPFVSHLFSKNYYLVNYCFKHTYNHNEIVIILFIRDILNIQINHLSPSTVLAE